MSAYGLICNWDDYDIGDPMAPKIRPGYWARLVMSEEDVTGNDG